LKILVDNITKGDKPMITFDQVTKAISGDRAVYAEIYNYFFQGRVQGWLVAKGIDDAAEREDIIGEMTWSFVKHLKKFKKNGIKFDAYMWTEFNFCFLNYVKRINKQRKRHTEITPDCFVTLDFGNIEVETKVDVEILRSEMTGKTRRVFSAMASGLSRKDMPLVELTVKDWDNERINIQKTALVFDYVYY
jgi:hypothetical protein